MDKYTLNFSNAEGQPVEVIILDTATSTSVERTLTPSDDPFVIFTSGSQDDPMDTLKYTTAEISVLTQYSSTLDVTSDKRYIVILLINGATKWAGYINREILTQEYSGTIDKFTYRCTDMFGLLLNSKISSNSSVIYAMRLVMISLPNDIAQYLQDYGRLYVSDIALAYGKTMLDMLSIQLPTDEFKDTDNNGKQVLMHYSDILADWATINGCTIASNGIDIFIYSSEGGTSANAIGLWALAISGTDGWSEDKAAIGQVGFETFAPLDNNTISENQAPKSVTLEYGGSRFNDFELPELAFKNRKVRWVSNEKESKGVSFPWFVVYTDNLVGSGVTIRRMKIRNQEYELPDIYPPYFYPNVSNFKNGCSGAALLKHDYWNTGKDDKGSGDTEEGNKYNYTFSDVLCIWGVDGGWTEDGGNRIQFSGSIMPTYKEASKVAREILEEHVKFNLDRYLVKMESKNEIHCVPGGISISFKNVMGINIMPLKFESKSGPSEKKMLMCELSIGNKWWNGDEWTSNRASFYIQMGENLDGTINKYINGPGADVVNTKTLSQLFTCTGYSIPVDEKMTGKAIFKIFACVGEYTSSVSHGNKFCEIYSHDITYISDLKIEHNKKIDLTFSDFLEPNGKLSQTNSEGNEDIKKNTKFCSGSGLCDNTGVVSEYASVTYDGSIYAKIEDACFDRMKRLLYKPATTLSLGNKSSSILNYITEFSGSGNKFRLSAIIRYDVCTCEGEYTFIQI